MESKTLLISLTLYLLSGCAFTTKTITYDKLPKHTVKGYVEFYPIISGKGNSSTAWGLWKVENGEEKKSRRHFVNSSTNPRRVATPPGNHRFVVYFGDMRSARQEVRVQVLENRITLVKVEILYGKRKSVGFGKTAFTGTLKLTVEEPKTI